MGLEISVNSIGLLEIEKSKKKSHVLRAFSTDAIFMLG